MREMAVYVIDDDAEMRECLEALLHSVGLATRAFSSGSAFLESYDGSQPGCLLLDVRMPHMSGLMVQEELLARGVAIPIVFLSGHGDVATAVAAMRKKASDFLLKPFSEQQLLDSVQRAIEQARCAEQRKTERVELDARLASLSVREMEILERVRRKQNAKLIACDLGLSRKTVDTHLAAIRRKLRIESTTEALALLQNLPPRSPAYSL